MQESVTDLIIVNNAYGQLINPIYKIIQLNKSIIDNI